MTGKVYNFDSKRTLKNPKQISRGDEVIDIDGGRSPVQGEEDRYLGAVKIIEGYREVAAGLTGKLDSHLNETAHALEYISGNFLEELKGKVGEKWILNYVQATKYLQNTLREVIEKNMEVRHGKHLEIIAEHERVHSERNKSSSPDEF